MAHDPNLHFKISQGIKSGIQLKSNYKNYHVHKFLNQTICCGYSKELTYLDGYFEHPNIYALT